MRKERLILASLVIVLIVFVGLAFALPNLQFLFPSVPDNGYSLKDSVTINVSINNTVPNSVWLDWNNSLMVYLPFDYYNDTGVFDNSSYGMFGEFKGNLSINNISSGIRGNSLDFDGESDYFLIKNSELVNTENYTFSFWIKTESSSLGDQVIITNGNDNGEGVIDSVGIRQGKIGWNYVNAGSYKEGATSTVNDGAWHHVVISVNSTRNSSLFIDGVQDIITTTSFYRSDSTGNSYIGCRIASEYFFNGSIDEVMVFNRSLSTEEIRDLYNHTASYYNNTQSNLQETFYNYSVYAMSLNGELEKTSRSFWVDLTGVGTDFVWPTPVDLGNHPNRAASINVSIGSFNQNHSVFVDLNNDLLGYWSFDYYNETGVFDNSSYDNFGEFNENLSLDNLTAGARGRGLDFDASFGYVGLNEEVVITGNSTISFWAKKSDWSDNRVVLGNSGTSMYSFVYFNSVNRLYIESDSSGDNAYAVLDNVDNDMHHYIIVLDNYNVQIYQDGVALSMGDGDISDDVTLNRIGAASGSYNFNGTIDEVMIFNRTLNNDEILYLYNSTDNYFQEAYSELEEGNNSLNVYAIDIAGNLEKISRSFVFDSVVPGIQFLYPTPGNQLQTSELNHTINVTLTNSTNSSLWIDWENDLVGYWSFDYANENGIYDNSSNSNFATFNGNLGIDNLSVGVRGNALDFYGDAPSYLWTSRVNFHTYPEGWSTFAWVKYYDNGGLLASIFGGNMLSVRTSDGALRIYDGMGYKYSSGTLSEGTWIHVGATCDNETNILNYYINGVNDSEHHNFDCDYSLSIRFYSIGNYYVSSSPWNGSIDEAIIFNRSLTLEDVQALYNGTESYLSFSKNDLIEGTYNYDIYATDLGGNMEILSRNLTINSTTSEIGFEKPTPIDNVYFNNESALINVSITNPTNTSVFIDWNKSLIGYYSFDYYNSTGVFDNSSYDNFAGFGGNLGLDNLTGGRSGSAFEFDGVGDYIQTPIIPGNMTQGTISMWVYQENLGDLNTLMGSRLGGSTQIKMGITSNNFYFWVGSSSENVASILTEDSWHHVVLTWNETNTLGYVNLINSAQGDSNVSNLPEISSLAMSIGAFKRTSSYETYSKGKIDEVLIFNRSLSYDEIAYLYNNSNPYFNYQTPTLSEGNNYSFSIFSIDVRGNLKKLARSFLLDLVSPGLSWVWPTPDDDLYSRDSTPVINASLANNTDTSVWFDWNNTLVGYWSMDYYNSTGVFDNSSYGRFATFAGNLTKDNITGGIRGGALKFDGKDSYLRFSRINISTFAEGWSAFAWVKHYGVSGQNEAIFGGYFLQINSGDYRVQSYDGSGYKYSNVNISKDIWAHVGAVCDNSTNILTYYINGVNDSSQSYNCDYYNGNRIIYIGSYNSISYFFNGSIDEVMIFNRSLTNEEVNNLYNATDIYFEQQKSNLEEGTYNYSVYANDRGGNMEILSRNLTVDRTNPVLIFVEPTPEEGGGTDGNLQFNVSILDEQGFSIWFEDNNSLLGYWSFDYYNETGIFDNSSSELFGMAEFQNGVGLNNLTKGKRGYGLEFDGDDDYLNISEISDFDLGNETSFTVTAWAWDKDPGGGNTWMNIVEKGNSRAIYGSSDYGAGFGFGRYSSTANRFAFGISDGNNGGYFSSNTLSSGYHFLTMVVDRNSDLMYGYVDGVLADSLDISSYGEISSPGEPLRIGYGNFNWNGSVDEVMIFNRSLTLQEIQDLYNATSSQFFERTYSNVDAGYHNYSVGVVDRAGNFVRYYRGFDVDDTLPEYEIVDPSPGNATYTGDFVINVSVSEEHLNNVTFDWNGTNYSLNITDDYARNTIQYTNISINATRVDNSTNLWEVLFENIYLGIGQSYWYRMFFKDKGGNQNSTSLRVIYGNNPPVFKFVNQFPNLSIEVDPNITINITTNVTDSDSDISIVILQWKKWGESYSNITMVNYSGTEKSQLLWMNFTPTQEGIYNYRIFANDSYGVENYSSEYNVSVYWDCSWTVNSSFDALAGYNENKKVGVLIINNTGDSEYATSSCSLNFRTTYNLVEGKVYFNNYYFKDQTFLGVGAGQTESILVNFSYGSEIAQDNLIITTTEIGGISNNNTINTTSTLITLRDGPYLYNEITTYPSSVYLISDTFILDGYLRNLMGSVIPNATNTAYNVSSYWSLPSGFSGNASTLEYENISDNVVRNNINVISFSDLASMTPGSKTFTLYSTGVNNTSGTIKDASGNSVISDSVSINFLCYSVSDGFCVEECGNSQDPDCPIETSEVVVEVSGGGGGGSSGVGNTGIREISEERFELVIGEKQEFPLIIENKFTVPKEDIIIEASNIDRTEIKINPSKISRIDPKSEREIKVILSSKKYLTQGTYDIIFTISGVVNDNGKKRSFTEKKTMQLYLIEIPRGEAESLINESIKIIEKMKQSNFSTKDVQEYLNEMNSSLNILDFGGVEENYQQLNELYEVAENSNKLIEELGLSISNSEYKGIEVIEAKKTFLVAKKAFQRGDYHMAYQKVKEAQLTYALETKGKFNILRYVKNHPFNSLMFVWIFFTIFLAIFISSKYVIYKNKIRNLNSEEILLLDLMKVVQKQCFEENKLSMGQYGEAVAQYENKLSKAVQRRVNYESRLANLFNIRGTKKALNLERKRLIELIKDIQEDYMLKGKLETRIYEGMLKSYSTRLTEVEEGLVFFEARKALRGKGFFSALFIQGNKQDKINKEKIKSEKDIITQKENKPKNSFNKKKKLEKRDIRKLKRKAKQDYRKRLKQRKKQIKYFKKEMQKKEVKNDKK